MKISKEEIAKLADTINIDVNETEIKQIQNSISNIAAKLDELLKVEENDTKRRISNVTQVNVYDNNNENEELESDLFTNINNYDGEYVNVKKVIDNE